MESKDIVSILSTDTVTPLVRLFSEFGPFALCIIFLLVAYSFFRSTGGRPFAWVFVGATVVSGVFGVFVWLNPPKRYYVHEMTVSLTQPASRQTDNGLSIYSNEPRVWVNYTVPTVRNAAGQVHFEWRVLVLDQEKFDPNAAFALRIGWTDDSGSRPFTTFDDLTANFAGGAVALCTMTRNDVVGADSVSGTKFKLNCVRQTVESSLSTGLIATAYAQTPMEAPDYTKMSREELIQQLEHLKKPGNEQQNAGPPSAIPLPSEASAIPLRTTKRPVVVYYAKPEDSSRVSDAILPFKSNVVEKPSQLPAPTNSVWFGRDVDLQVAKQIASALIDAGVKLVYFGPFVDTGSKTNLVEIGSWMDKAGEPALTKADIEKYQPHPRN